MRLAQRVFGWIYCLLCEGAVSVLYCLSDRKAMKALQTRRNSLPITRVQPQIGSAKAGECTGLPQLLDIAGAATAAMLLAYS